MTVVEELIRAEKDGRLSFGNYLLANKQKVQDFELDGNLYYVKTYNEITRVEKNGRLLYESVPGTAVFNMAENANGINFSVMGKGSCQITLELMESAEYKIFFDDINAGKVKSNLSGKSSFSVDFQKKPVSVRLEKV